MLSSFFVTDTSDDPNDPGSLRYAIAEANAAHDAVNIHFNLTTPATITLTHGALELSNAAAPQIRIDGPGAELLTIEGNQSSRVLVIDGGVTATLSGMTLTGGAGFYGGDVLNLGSVTLSGVDLEGGSAFGGAGLANTGTADLIGCTIRDNQALSGAGVLNNGPDASMRLVECTVTGNVGFSGSAARNLYGTLTASDSTFQANYGGGTVIEADRGPATEGVTLTRCTITGNAGVVENRYSHLTIGDCVIAGNVVYGGALSLIGGATTITGTTIRDNVSSDSYSSGIGVIADEGTLSLSDCTITGNVGGYLGGGLTMFGTQLTMTDCSVVGNSATYGGGLFLGNSDFGGGASATITGCTFSGNSAVGAVGQGGGLCIAFGSSAALTNCTIANNSAGWEGGGIFNQAPAELDLVACTISGNSAGTSGGGLYNISYGYSFGDAIVRTTDTIIAGNTASGAPSDIAGNQDFNVTGSYNLVGTGGSGGLSAADHNLLGVPDPGLAPLGDYGGPTQTMALLPGSPAVGQGIAVPGVVTDQRGDPLDHPVDIGAFQLSVPAQAGASAATGAVSPPGPLVVIDTGGLGGAGAVPQGPLAPDSLATWWARRKR